MTTGHTSDTHSIGAQEGNIVKSFLKDRTEVVGEETQLRSSIAHLWSC